MDDDIVKQAIDEMVNDIKLTMGFDDNTIYTCRISISIVCCDNKSLLNAIRVFEKLNIRSKYILFVPITIRKFNFDTIDVANIFGCIKSTDPNVTSVIIHDSDRMDSGDFHIDIFIEKIESGGNDYIGYQPLSRYCNDLTKR